MKAFREMGWFLLVATFTIGAAAHAQPSPCVWVKEAAPFAFVEGRRDAVVDRLNSSLAHLEGVLEKRAMGGIAAGDVDCSAQIQAKLDLALDSFRVPLDGYIPFHFWLGRYQIFKSDEAAAIQSLVRVTELDTLHLGANFWLGRLYLERGQRDAALKNYRRVTLIENLDPVQKMRVVEVLRELVAGLEPLPERVLEYATQLQKLAGLQESEKIRLAKLAIEAKLFARAEEMLAQVAQPKRSIVQVELARERNDPVGDRLDRIKKLFNNAAARAELGEVGMLRLADEWSELARTLKDWAELRRAVDFVLERKPKDPRYLGLLEDAVRLGELRGTQELQATVKLHPTSPYLQRRLVEELLMESLRAGVGAVIPKDLLKEGEIQTARLSALTPKSADAQFWKAFVLGKKKNFRNADLNFSALVKRIRDGATLEAPVRDLDLWREAARAKEARGYTAESISLLTEAIGRTEKEEEKSSLQRYIEGL